MMMIPISTIPGISEQSSVQIAKLFSALPLESEAIIFGSRAKGTNREGSDIDIALKGKEISQETRDLILAKYEELYLPWKLDLVIYFMITEPALIEHIDRVGITFLRCEKLDQQR